MAASPALASAPPRSQVQVTQTSADLSQAMRSLPARRFSPTTRIARGVRVIDVDDTHRYQRFIGAGGGMTDSSAWLIWTQLAPTQRSRLMNLLFAPSGAHLSFLRVSIGASDYTADGTAYSYDDEPAGQTDPQLADFSVAHDEPYILPALRAAQQLNPKVYVEGVSWSAPGWMKANDALDNTAHAGTLLPQLRRRVRALSRRIRSRLPRTRASGSTASRCRTSRASRTRTPGCSSALTGGRSHRPLRPACPAFRRRVGGRVRVGSQLGAPRRPWPRC